MKDIILSAKIILISGQNSYVFFAPQITYQRIKSLSLSSPKIRLCGKNSVSVSNMIKSESEFQILRALHSNPNLSQRELSKKSGVSLGQVNYCLNALVQKGWVKLGKFTASKNRKRYAYILTPKGMEQKAKATYHFLRRKMEEYEALEREIEELRAEVQGLRAEEQGPRAESQGPRKASGDKAG
jgi:EPS-associated MarR family transcriptional regulator